MGARDLVDVVLAVLAIEAAVLAFLSGRLRLPPFGALWPNLVAGLCLVLAVRCAVTESGTAAIATFLALGGAAHALDLFARRRR